MPDVPIGPSNPHPPQRLTKLLRPTPEEGVRWEIEHHIEERVERLVGEGWDEDAAREEASRLFGDVAAYTDEAVGIARDTRSRRWTMERLGDVGRDLRWTFRGVRRSPTFATTLVLTLALGIGGITSIFAVLDAVLLRPLPYDAPDELVDAWMAVNEQTTVPFLPASQADSWRFAMEDILTTGTSQGMNLVRTDGTPELIRALAVSHDLDELLGVRMRLGRAFSEEDSRAGAERVALMTYPYWVRSGADEQAVGRTIRLEEETWTVVGVLPYDFKYPVAGTNELWIPLWTDGTAGGHGVDRLEVIGRLQPGVTIERAQERAEVIAESLAREEPTAAGWDVRLRDVGAWRGNSDLRRSLWMLVAAGGLMLLIALVNGVNFLLLQAQARARDFAVRRAIGASGRRIFQAVVTESVVLGVVSGGAAALVAALALEGIKGILPSDFAFASVYPFVVEGRTVTFAFALGLLAGLLGGLGPALWTARQKSRGPSSAMNVRGGSGRSARFRQLLVVTEVGLSVALLVGASLFLRSFSSLVRTDPGFDAESIAVAELTLSRRVYTEGADARHFANRVVERVASLPGAEAAIATQGLPPDGGGLFFGEEFQAEGAEPIGEFRVLPFAVVPPEYVEVLGLEIIAGRGLVAGDADADHVVIDRDLAIDLFGSEAPLGSRFRVREGEAWMTVVGVVDELKLGGLDDQYGGWAMMQAEDAETISANFQIVARGRDPEALLPGIRAAIAEVDGQQPIRALHTAQAALGASMARPRFLLVLMGSLAGLALVLAFVGTYGVMAYAVRRRRRETAIRIALGASADRIQARILRSGLALAAGGVASGVILASALTRYAEALLYQIEPLDPLAFGMAAVTMITAAAAASWLPARRATRVDPVVLLREE
jgi:predicted permease